MPYVSTEEWQPSPGIKLSAATRKIVTEQTNIAISAGPGSGKTEILAQRASYLLTTGLCPYPERILAIAFKVDAANNIKKRVEKRAGDVLAKRFDSYTIHAFAKRIIDQFREALPAHIRPKADYLIFTPRKDDFEEFRRSVSEKNSDIAITVRSFGDKETGALSNTIPPPEEFLSNQRDRVLFEWWNFLLHEKVSKITFDMILGLAAYILETQPIIRNLYKQTYKFVFLDEFQDVTKAQYKLIKAIFHKSDAILTAVGDTQQAIMGFAGADKRIFERLEEDFSATPNKLETNFRSNAAIVNLINLIAKHFFKATKTECGRADDSSPSDAIETWTFGSRESESAYLASFIQESIARTPILKQHDFIILTKILVDDVEKRLIEQFSEKNLSLRNEARKVGGIPIQDLMEDAVFNFVLSAVKLAVNIRTNHPFEICRDFLAAINGFDTNDEKGHGKLLTQIRSLVSDLKTVLADRPPSQSDADKILNSVFGHTSEENIKKTYPEYRSRNRLDEVKAGFKAFFLENAKAATDWETCIKKIEGIDQVKLMTVHKSKGLEYHTVIFTELNDDAFWANDDEAQLFFVAMSRAKERVRFSFVRGNRGFQNVKEFYSLLKSANVPIRQVE